MEILSTKRLQRRMIYFEDLVINAYNILRDGTHNTVSLSEWSRNFILNIGSKLADDGSTQLSTNQSAALKKVLPYFVRFFVHAGYDRNEVEDALAYPIFKSPLYNSPAVKRECRHLGANLLGFRFKFNPTIAKDIQDKATGGYYRFDKQTKLWIVTVTINNYQTISSAIYENRFELNGQTEKWLQSLKHINDQTPEERISTFAYDAETACVVVNVVANEKLEHFVQYFLESIYV